MKETRERNDGCARIYMEFTERRFSFLLHSVENTAKNSFTTV